MLPEPAGNFDPAVVPRADVVHFWSLSFSLISNKICSHGLRIKNSMKQSKNIHVAGLALGLLPVFSPFPAGVMSVNDKREKKYLFVCRSCRTSTATVLTLKDPHYQRPLNITSIFMFNSAGVEY